jgi:hypothetical protein
MEDPERRLAIPRSNCSYLRPMLGVDPKFHARHFSEVMSSFVGDGRTEPSRERIGLLDVDELQARAHMGQENANSKRDRP